MKSKIILCTGGARSGKSEFAESLALSFPGQKVYIATAQVFDTEMEERVDKHKKRRGSQWKNFELPLKIAEQWTSLSAEGDVFLIDCLTMLTTNYLMEESDYEDTVVRNRLTNTIHNELTSLCSNILETENKTIIFVTNEIGLGIVPENTMTRLFRDLVGEVNQITAKAAAEVYLTISGITVEIKSREVQVNG